MPNNIKHVAVHADDVDRARKFYESVLGWQFTRSGPPNFYLWELQVAALPRTITPAPRGL